MAAHDPASITNGAGKMVYVGRVFNRTHTVTTNQKMNFNLAARGTQELYTAAPGSVQTTTDGGPIVLEGDPTFSSFTVDTNATAKINAGSLWFRNDGSFAKEEWRIRSVQIDNITTPTSLTSMVLERADNPMITMNLNSETMSQP